ncbi:MAG: HD domain-containing phosphohydrolase, partial [Armatimonadota bacterium]
MEGTILVVDDDPNARSLLERLLGEQGHVVMTARDGAEAIALIPEIRPDLHERWDGKGYPNGLAGGAIPLGARIVSIADGFDAYTSDRPYRS